MANTNTLTAIHPKILAQGLMALRENCVAPRLVNSDYSSDAAQKGTTIDVPIPAAVAVTDVAPANISPDIAGVTPTSVQVPLDKWKDASFFLSDKDIKEVEANVVPMQVSEAIKAIANQVNTDIYANYVSFYGVAGDTADSPFNATDGTKDATTARKVLNKQLAPLTDRRMVLDPEAEALALDLRAFQDQSWRGDASGIIQGTLNRKFGFDFFMDQLIPTHTAGAFTTGSPITDGAATIGDTSSTWDDTALVGSVKKGDIFTVAGDSQTYVVTADATAAANSITVAFYPGAKVAWADGAAVTLTASHVVNLAFHRDAIAFATRPLEDLNEPGLGSIIQSAVDPISGLSLRLELTREHKRLKWSFDILYGSKTVRPELGARLIGKVV